MCGNLSLNRQIHNKSYTELSGFAEIKREHAKFTPGLTYNVVT